LQAELREDRYQPKPQGGVISPMLSNILLTPFDQEMRRKGYQLTRYADDWVITCQSAAEARAALEAAVLVLNQLGVHLNVQKTCIVHVQHGFEFLGYKIKRGKQLRLPVSKIRSGDRFGGAVRLSEREVGSAVQRPATAAHQAKDASRHPRADTAD
jgi:hypothetical protein